MLVSAVASAQEQTPRFWKTAEDFTIYERILNGREVEETHATRHLLLRHDPTDAVREVYVAGGESTIIRLPSKPYARGTGIFGGGERRFEVAMAGQRIFVTPTQKLAKGERFPMIVTLADGTVIPLSLTSAPEGKRTDGEVQISMEPENPEELRAQLVSMAERAKSFEASFRQALREQDSADYALAGLLAGNRAELTAFIRVKERSFFDGAGRKITLQTYASPADAPHAANEVAAVFAVTNRGSEPLEFSAGRAFRNPGPDSVSVALRVLPRVIPPGAEGKIAVVLDRASFGPRGDGKIAIDFFSKTGGGQTEFSADLVMGDFEEESSWWPF